MTRTYSELITIPTFEERFEYLKLNGRIGEDTFGFDRIINQNFYKSKKWKHIRDLVIIRDEGCDLGMYGYDIQSKIIIHHINPINQKDILDMTEYLLNPEFLICTSINTHNAIHYGNKNNLITEHVERTPNDMCPWKVRGE